MESLARAPLTRTPAGSVAVFHPAGAPASRPSRIDHLWRCGGRTFDFSSGRGMIMGVLNVTPDSFSDGGRFSGPGAAVEHGLRMESEGAEILDIGGESTRPGASPVDADEELRRVLPVVRALRGQSGALLSIDTTKAVVARACLDEGVDILNDISALTADPGMPALAARERCGVVLMHMRGTPRTMQSAPDYRDVVAEVEAYLESRLCAAGEAGIDPARVALDPGIGFGKTFEHNRLLLAATARFAAVGRPLLVGVSRKSFLGAAAEAPDVSQRLWPGVAMTAFCRGQGARIFRVHDIRENLHALRMTEALLSARTPPNTHA